MTLTLLLGGGFGFGLFALVRGLYPPRPSLAAELAGGPDRARPRPAVTHAPGRQTRADWLVALLGQSLARLATALGLRLDRTRRDLAVAGRPLERHLAEKLGLALFGLLLAPATAAVTAAFGVPLPLAVPLWAGIVLGIGGFFLPDLGLRADADAQRREVRDALGLFLDLTVVSLAGGAGVESALADAATVGGQGSGATHLRRALATARLRREPPWAALATVGEELGVPELVELAGSVGMAGTEGAKVRASLAAKAASLRAHQLAEAETDAQAATERMSLPVVVLFAGFLLFIGFPAMARVLAGF